MIVQIGHQGQGPPTCPSDLGRRRLQAAGQRSSRTGVGIVTPLALAPGPPGEGDVPTGAGQGDGRGPTDPPGGAGDHRPSYRARPCHRTGSTSNRRDDGPIRSGGTEDRRSGPEMERAPPDLGQKGARLVIRPWSFGISP